jgi:hypothetical protein
MSSVWTTSAPSVASLILAANVVLPNCGPRELAAPDARTAKRSRYLSQGLHRPGPGGRLLRVEAHPSTIAPPNDRPNHRTPWPAGAGLGRDRGHSGAKPDGLPRVNSRVRHGATLRPSHVEQPAVEAKFVPLCVAVDCHESCCHVRVFRACTLCAIPHNLLSAGQ